MRKSALLILGLLLACVGYAKEVTEKDASQAALRIMNAKSVNVTDVKSIEAVYDAGVKSYFIVNFVPEGWALISADDVVLPLIGYSEKGNFSVDMLPDNMRGWLELKAKEMVEYTTLSNERCVDWDKLPVEPMSVGTRASSKINPIITVNWNQGNPYNKYCPSNSSGRAVVGCVAVAMAQAMSVAQYPPRPHGYEAYNSPVFGSVYCDYDKEPDYNWDNILSGANNYDDAARLMWHCGVSVNMEYTLGGSGAMTGTVPSALKEFFSYPSAVTYYSRSSISDDNWKAMIINELENGRAVIYCGYPASGGAGHCFNLDGYDGSGSYHVNWGWGGAGNGWFTLDQLKSQVVPGGAVMEFTVGHGMVINVRAPSDKPSDIKLSNTSVLENKPAGTVVGDVTVVNEATNHTYTYEVKGKKTLFGYAKVPFNIKNGKLVTTEVLKASDYVDPVTNVASCSVTIIATDNNNSATVSKTFTITIKDTSGINDVTIEENAPVEYYNLQGVKVENPENGIFIKRQGSKATKVIL